MNTGGGSPQRLVVALGGERDPDAAAQIRAGSTPDVEFEHILNTTDSIAFDFGALGSTRSTRLLRRLVGPYWTAAVMSVIKHSSSTIVVASGEDLGLRFAILHGLLRPRRRRPFIAMVFHGSYLASPRAAKVVRSLRSRTDIGYLCLSTSLRDQLVEVFRVDPGRTEVVGYGVDTDFFHPAGERDASSRPCLVSAGLASRDFTTLIEAVRGLDVDLKIAADSTWFSNSPDIDQSTLPDDAEVRSFGNYESLRDLYARATVVVVPLHPVRHAAGYAVIIEAMAMGKPVITSDITGKSDLVRHGETGLLVPAGDPSALRDAICSLLDDPHAADEIGRRARELVRSTANLPDYARTIIDDARRLEANRSPR